MSPVEASRMALISIRANKMRSALTMLGVIIGVGSVITMIALGKGAGADVQERFKSMGTNLLMVRPGQMRPGRMFGSEGAQDTLKIADAEAISRSCPSVAAVSPQVNSSQTIKWRNNNATVSVVGCTPDYAVVSNFPAQRGRYFTLEEMRGRRPVCLIGTTVVKNVFGRSDPLGQRLRVKNISMEIIGILKEKGGGDAFRDPDEVVLVPLTVAMGQVMGIDYINQIVVRARSEQELTSAQDEMTRLLRRRHRIREGKADDFNIRQQAEMLQMFSETSRTFTVLLAGIACLSLLVGGIGVMNIMLVSVTERTREIGIRKAVGARRSDIMMQFLVESLTLCMVGGLIGVGLGIGASAVVAKVAQWRTLVSMGSIVLAFGFSAAVGVIFGLYPAQKAAKLNPIEALRYE